MLFRYNSHILMQETSHIITGNDNRGVESASYLPSQRWARSKCAFWDWDWDFTHTSLNFETETDAFHLHYLSSILRLHFRGAGPKVRELRLRLSTIIKMVCFKMSVKHFQETFIKILWSKKLLKHWLRLYWYRLIFETENEIMVSGLKL